MWQGGHKGSSSGHFPARQGCQHIWWWVRRLLGSCEVGQAALPCLLQRLMTFATPSIDWDNKGYDPDTCTHKLSMSHDPSPPTGHVWHNSLAFLYKYKEYLYKTDNSHFSYCNLHPLYPQKKKKKTCIPFVDLGIRVSLQLHPYHSPERSTN